MDISVKSTQLNRSMTNLRYCENQVALIQREIDHIRWNLAFEVKSKHYIDYRLRQVRDDSLFEINAIRNMNSSLRQIQIKYNNTENNIKNHSRGKKNSIAKSVGGGLAVGAAARVIGPAVFNVGKNAKVKEGATNVLKLLTKFGDIGKTASFIPALLSMKSGKVYSNGGKIVTGAINSGLGLSKVVKGIKEKKGIKDLLGLKVSDTIKTATKGKAGWAKRFAAGKAVFKEGFKKSNIILTSIDKITSNFQDYKDGKHSFGRFLIESVSETGVDLLKTAAIGAGVAALCAGAPAVVVGGIAVGASILLDVGCKAITKKFFGEEKDLTETISDGVLSLVGKTRGVRNAKAAWAFVKKAF